MGDLRIEEPPLRSQQDNWPTLIDRFGSSKSWFRLHNHAGPTTIGIIIDNMMSICSGLTNIVQRYAEQPPLLRPLDNALSEWPLEHPRKKRKDVEMHNCPHLLRGLHPFGRRRGAGAPPLPGRGVSPLSPSPRSGPQARQKNDEWMTV